MNSRASGLRSHKRGVKVRTWHDCPTAPLNWSEGAKADIAEAMDQAEQRGIGHRLVPMIEHAVERSLAPHDADDGTQRDGHPQQRGEAAGKADAAERGENDQNDHSQGKANDHLRRSQFLR